MIIEPEGEPKKILRVTLPLGMQLVHGTRVIVDNNPPAQSPYVICFANGCMSDYEVTPELLANMKKGQNLVVQAINSNGAPLTLPLPLAEFAKAYDGPPTDPKVFEETQKKLQEELQKRADEARKKLEPTAGAAASRRSSASEISPSTSSTTKKAPGSGAFFVESGIAAPARAGAASIQRRIARPVAARFVLDENLGDLRMPDRLAEFVGQQILLGNVGDVFGFRILGEQMIERLILVRPDILRDRQPPFLGIVEFRIDIENHAPERKNPVADDLSDLKLGGTRFYHVSSNRP